MSNNLGDLTLDDYISIGKESQSDNYNYNYTSQDESTQFNNCTFNFYREPVKRSSNYGEGGHEEYICPNVLNNTGVYCEEYCSDCEEAGAKYQKEAFSPFDLGIPLGLLISPFYYPLKGLVLGTKALITPRVVDASSESDKIMYSDDTIIDTEVIDAEPPKMIAEKPRENDLQKWQREDLEHQVEMARLEKEHQQLLTDSNAQKIVRIKMNEPKNDPTPIVKTPNTVFGAMKAFEEAK